MVWSRRQPGVFPRRRQFRVRDGGLTGLVVGLPECSPNDDLPYDYRVTGGIDPKTGRMQLKESIAKRTKRDAYAELTPDSSFAQLVEVWLEDLDLEDKLAPNTRALYERTMRQLVLPAFEHLAIREISTGRVDRFLKKFAITGSHSMAKQAKTLSLAFGLAVRYDALVRNPVRETARLRKPPHQADAPEQLRGRLGNSPNRSQQARAR